MRACEKLSQNKGVQFEKEYKTGYNSVLDDDEILANREEESLEEEVINEARKYEVDNNFVYIGTGDDQSSIGEIWDDGTLELYHPEQFDAKERARMRKDLKNYDISFLDEDNLHESAVTDNGRHIARQGGGWIHRELFRLSDAVDQLNRRKSLHPGEKEAAKAIIDVANDIRRDLINDVDDEDLNEDTET